MTHVITQLNDNVDKLKEISECYLGKERAANLYSELMEKQQEKTLQVMLFGSYNAGKSSLINALIGDEQAGVADVPKTATADRYEWNGCYLLDTPGVNAPIEHEALTKEQLKRSELMLFVIREGDQDVKDVYERMFEMLAQDKKVFIVFNHQLSGDDLVVAQQRLAKILSEYAGQHNIDQEYVAKIPQISINIKTAFTAALKDNLKLAEHSGILEFKDRFSNWLSEYDTETGYLDQLKKFVNQCLLDDLLKTIEQEKSTKDDSSPSSLQQQRELLAKEARLTKSTVNNFVRKEIVLLKPRIIELFKRASSAEDLQAGMQQFADGLLAKVQKLLTEKYHDSDANLTALVSAQNEMSESNSGTDYADVVGGAAMKGLKNIDATVVEKGLLIGRALKIPGLKGRWGSTFGKWAGKAGPVIQVVTAVVEMFVASHKQDKENEQARQQEMSFHQAIEEGSSCLNSAITEAALTAIDQQYEGVLEDLELKIAEAIKLSDQCTQDHEQVLALKARIEQLSL